MTRTGQTARRMDGFHRTLFAAGLLGLFTAAIAAAQPAPLPASNPAPEPPLEPIRVGPGGTHFVGATSGRLFTPWGFNYDHDADGALLEDYWEARWPEVVADFAEMKALGANVVRIHLQVGRFMKAAGRTDSAALERLARLVEVAESNRLYLDVTGLGCYHKADVPAWYDALSEAHRWEVQARFWEAVAAACRKSPAIFCYDLMNEPIVGGGNPAETNWLAGDFGGKHFVQRIALDLAGRSREEVARAWVNKLVAAIRRHDPDHLITVGVIPWALTFPGATPLFHGPEAGAKLDFVAVHFYPETGAIGKALEALKVYEVGKPLVVEEIFPLRCGVADLGQFMDRSRGHVDGWIGFYWGRTIEDYEAGGGGIAEAMTLEWLRFFRDKAGAMSAAPRR